MTEKNCGRSILSTGSFLSVDVVVFVVDIDQLQSFLYSSGLAGDKEEQGQLRSGREVLNMLKEKMTIRIFDPLGEHHHEGLRRHGEGVTETDKLDLKDDYETPAPLGLDLFRECGQLTDYQWTLLSGGASGDNDGDGLPNVSAGRKITFDLEG